jgi:ketosteroid isomerase-like protein
MRYTTCLLSLSLLVLSPGLAAADDPPEVEFDLRLAERLAGLALDCVDREYPNKISHVLQSDEDVAPPRELTPAFFGCFDWHSAVHGHWMLARLARSFPGSELEATARAELEQSLTPEKLAGDLRYLRGEGREPFERPYGLAWLLQLAVELREWDDPQAARWSAALAPLEAVASNRLARWIKKLSHPIREGEHEQTAFAFGLTIDWARSVNDWGLKGMLTQQSRRLYLGDRSCPLGYEPSGQDFLSPCLAEADLARRLLPPERYAHWLGDFLPGLPLDGSADWLRPAVVTDAADGKLVHLDGLNLSRAWMLEGIASGLPPTDPRRPGLMAAAEAHRRAGLASVTGEHYEGGHWLASFAVYLLTRRGIDNEGAKRITAKVEPDETAPRSPAEVASRVLDEWHEAARVPDGERYFAFMDPDAIFMGTDASERWSVEEYRAFAEPYFSQGKGWSFVPRDRHLNVSTDGSLAWFDEMLDSDSYGEARGSGVLRRDGQSWKILHYNLAFTVPNEVARDVVALIREAKPAGPEKPEESGPAAGDQP